MNHETHEKHEQSFSQVDETIIFSLKKIIQGNSDPKEKKEISCSCGSYISWLIALLDQLQKKLIGEGR
jgi:hypothetical protein